MKKQTSLTGTSGGQSQSATADTHEAVIISSVVPGPVPILSAGALLRAAAEARRLLSAAAGERDASERPQSGGSRSPGLDGAAAGTTGGRGVAAGDARSAGCGGSDGRQSR
jgi:hypothetical protein